MSEGTLRVALAGAGGFGAHALKALRDSELVELVALSDRDPGVAEAASAESGCAAYTDHRRLLVETAPQAVFLAVPPPPAGEIVKLASRRGVHVWLRVPPGRNLPQTAELCRIMDAAGLKLAVGTQRRFMAGYRRAWGMLARLGEVHAIRAHYQYNLGHELGWRGDKSAGGGALIEQGYHMLDLVCWLVGLPEVVYGLTATGQRPPGGEQPVYDSDDTAVAVLRYPRKVAATVTVTRCFSPVSEGVTIHGQAGTLSAGPGECVLRDRDGTVVEGFSEDESLAAVFAGMIESFARAAAANAPRYECSARENLLTMAVVDAAYLSDQTGQCESPGDLLAGYNLTRADCLKYTPTGDAQR